MALPATRSSAAVSAFSGQAGRAAVGADGSQLRRGARQAGYPGRSRHRRPPPARDRSRVRAVPGRRSIRGCAPRSNRAASRQLYTHQAEAFEHVANGRQVVVTTPTASGKTLCYNLPVLDRILKKPSARALYLFPTKALAQDQMAELHELAEINRRGRRRGDRRAHLRRRHAAGCAPHHPHARAHRPQQSRHGALGDPAAPSAMGEAVREPRLRRHRRTARVSRRVRQPPDQRAAAAAAHLPALRIESAVHLLVGDDRQSRGAGRTARGETVRAGRRRAARRGARSSSSSSIRRSSIASSASAARTSPSRGASRASSCAATCR